MQNYKFVDINQDVRKYMKCLHDDYQNYSEMMYSETEFLISLILDIKPRKILELGVSSGTSSVAILNAIKNYDSRLYSIDLNTAWYKDAKQKTGWYVDTYEELLPKWKLYSGGLALKFMDDIGSDIDFCLIDTVHVNPGEILDFLMVLPYLKKDAIVVFHDTALHTKVIPCEGTEFRYTNNLLMSSISGEKILQSNFIQVSKGTYFQNIGAIKLNVSTKDNIWDIFNLMTIKWLYMPTDEQLIDITNYFSRHYDKYLIDYFKKVVDFQKTQICHVEETTNPIEIKNKKRLLLLQKIFSIINIQKNDVKFKQICIFGIKLKFKKK